MTERTCIVEDCDRPTRSKAGDYCAPHMHRIERHGDPQAHIPIAPPRRKMPPPVDYEDGTRTCRECGERKPLGDFPKDSRATKGYRPNCKTCHSQQEMARYLQDPGAARERMAQYRKDHPDRYRTVDRARYERHRGKRIAQATEASHRRRARMQGAEVQRGISIPYLRRRDGDACCYCGTDLVFGTFPKGKRPDNMATLEHRLPISRGGAHTDANCALACWRCNISKGSLTEDEWEAKQGKPRRLRMSNNHPGLTA